MPHNPWCVKPKPLPGAKLKLICLPFAGGSSQAYRSWVGLLPSSIELIAIELPGRGTRLNEPLIAHLPTLIPRLAHGLIDELDRPFIIFGHSMGTSIGFELTQFLLKNYNTAPDYLFFSGRSAPHLDDREEPIHQLDDRAFIQKLRSFEGTPAEVLDHEELMAFMLPIIRADFTMIETHVWDSYPPFNIPLTVFGGLADESARREELMAWKDYTTALFNVRMFPGGHFYIQKSYPTLLQALLRDLSNIINLNV